MGIPAVILAAGHGTLHADRDPKISLPKVLEDFKGRPMVARVVETAARAGFDPCIVVVNPVSCASVIRAVGNRKDYPELTFIVQKKRRGTADAVCACLPRLEALDASAFLVCYADMPLWSAETMKALALSHSTSEAFLSMVTVCLGREHPPELQRYGRVVRDARGMIERVVEVREATEEELGEMFVNPSLWVFERRWFAANARNISPCDRGDGHDPELHLPKLVAMAHRDGKPPHEFMLQDLREALGVNTAEEFVKVREVMEAMSVS